MHSSASAEDNVVVTPAHRELVRQNGFIESSPFRIWIDHDFVRTEQYADADVPALRYFLQIIEEVRSQHGGVYLLLVVSDEVSPPPPEVRRWMAGWAREHGSDGVAIVAARNSLFVVIVNLLMRALSLLRPRQRPAAFFTTEAEARRWLAALRPEGRHQGA